MDLEELWQRNKRFLGGLALGVLAFLVATWAIDAAYGRDLRAERARRARLEKEQAEPRYDASARAAAEERERALRASLARLVEAAAFRPREGFLPDGTSAINRYHRTVAEVRERALTAAGRAGLFVDRDLGLPELSPAREEEVQRYLEGLDAVERALDCALQAGVARVDDVAIRPDPSLTSRAGPGPVERTRVELVLAGDPGALARFLVLTQRAGAPLTLRAADLVPPRGRSSEARLAVELTLVRLALPEGSEEGGA